MPFQIVKYLQRSVARVLTVIRASRIVVVNPAGEWPDAIYAARPFSEVEEGTEPCIVHSFREQIQNLLLVCEDIGSALAALTGFTASGTANFKTTEGLGKNPAAKMIRDPVQV